MGGEKERRREGGKEGRRGQVRHGASKEKEERGKSTGDDGG